MTNLIAVLMLVIVTLAATGTSLAQNILADTPQEEQESTTVGVYHSYLRKTNEFEDREIRDFFRVLLDASHQSLEALVFESPEELHLRKDLAKGDIAFWLRRVSLALMAYSYHFYGYPPGIETDPELAELIELMERSYEAYWQTMFDSYNRLFGDSIERKEINYYAAGLKEDNEKGYSESGNLDKAFELSMRDNLTIGSELLEGIWAEELSYASKKSLRGYRLGSGMKDLDPKAKRVLWLGTGVWRVYQQVVQPFLEKLVRDY